MPKPAYFSQRAGLAEQAARHHHKPGPQRRQARVLEVERRPAAGRERLDDDVGPAHEVVEDLPGQRLAQVEADAALAGRHVEQQAAGVVAGDVVDERPDRAGDVEVVARLDADDVGTEVGHHPRRRRPGHRPRQVEHLDAVERAPVASTAGAGRSAPRPWRAEHLGGVLAEPRRPAEADRRRRRTAGPTGPARAPCRSATARRRRPRRCSRGPRTGRCAARRRAWRPGRSAASARTPPRAARPSS